jgi:hypothetical protein
MWTPLLAPARIRRLLTGTVIAVAVLTVAGLAILWPRGPAPALGGAAPLRYLDATVTSVRQASCQDLDAGGGRPVSWPTPPCGPVPTAAPR